MITKRENLLRVFRHQEPEWVPIVLLADGYNHPLQMPRGFYGEVIDFSIIPALSRYFDIDILDRANAYRAHYRNVEYTHEVQPDLQIHRWETPYGVITSKRRRVSYSVGVIGEPDLETWFPIEHPVKSVDDYRAFAHIIENLEYIFFPDDVAARRAEVGDDGVVTVAAPCSPLGMCVRHYLGVEQLAYAYYDHPRALLSLLETIAEKYYECYRGIAEQTTADGTINYDDTSTRAISPRMFRELEVPFLNRTADILHASGKFCMHHACGHVLDLMDDFAKTRIDAFDGPEPPPTGDTTIAEARRRLGCDFVIMGSVCSGSVFETGDPELVRGYVRLLFEEAGCSKGFLLDVTAAEGSPVASIWPAVDEAKKLSYRYLGR